MTSRRAPPSLKADGTIHVKREKKVIMVSDNETVGLARGVMGGSFPRVWNGRSVCHHCMAEGRDLEVQGKRDAAWDAWPDPGLMRRGELARLS
jgi:hypothetical protein